jgi:hypothetical protein
MHKNTEQRGNKEVSRWMSHYLHTNNNDIHYNDDQHNDNQHNDIPHKDQQQRNSKMTISIMTFRKMTFSIMTISRMTISIMAISIMKFLTNQHHHDHQHHDILHNGKSIRKSRFAAMHSGINSLSLSSFIQLVNLIAKRAYQRKPKMELFHKLNS